MSEPACASLPPEALRTPTTVNVFSVEGPLLLAIIGAVVAPAVMFLFLSMAVKNKFTIVAFYLPLPWLNSRPLLVSVCCFFISYPQRVPRTVLVSFLYISSYQFKLLFWCFSCIHNLDIYSYKPCRCLYHHFFRPFFIFFLGSSMIFHQFFLGLLFQILIWPQE